MKIEGHCPVCESTTVFSSENEWLRDHFFCARCQSIPRERALMRALAMFRPGWRSLKIHESSPGDRHITRRLQQDCPGYLRSHFFLDTARGGEKHGIRCEDLEMLTFKDRSIDIHITQDVMEHIFEPQRVFAEIARTLRPGGAHFFTVPIVRKDQPSVRRARRGDDGAVIHLAEPAYHGNPIDASGCLVTHDWGFDICSAIQGWSGLFTHHLLMDDLRFGIRAEYLDVFISVKPLDAP